MELQQRLDKIKRFVFIIFAILAFALIMCSSSFAVVETKSSPNYLVILVHGINATRAVFMGQGENGSNIAELSSNEKDYKYGDLKGYLENELGLKGYVYAYTFSERDGHIDLMANELGNPNWDNKAATIGGTMRLGTVAKEVEAQYTKIEKADSGRGNSWLKQAREDFKSWYAAQQRPKIDPKDVPESVIPKKYIIIAHSLGGVAVRSYLASNFYNNDVAALITLDSQHLGSDAALALKRLEEYYTSGQDFTDFETLIGLTILAEFAGRDDIGLYTASCATFVAVGRTLGDFLFIRGMLGWYSSQPAVQDMDSDGSFIHNLNYKPFVNSNEPLKVRMISGKGIPTPSGKLPANRYAIGLGELETLLTSDSLTTNALSSRVMATFLSFALGGGTNQSGDIYGDQKSQIAEGLTSLNMPNVDFKANYSYDFGNELSGLEAVLTQALGAVTALNYIPIPISPVVLPYIKLGIYLGYAGSIVDEFSKLNDGTPMPCGKYFGGHGHILEKAYEEKVVDHALEDFVSFGGKTNTNEVRDGISASTVSNSAEGYTAPEQAFALLSNFDNNGNTTSTYHTVTIEAFIEGGADQAQLFPIEVNGQKKWVSSVSVKEYPTAFKGVVNTFLPKKMQRFNYSENFAAWKPVGEVDEWGNFTIKDLHFAEGSNVLAFDAESWIGNSANKIIRITANTVPQFVTNPVPELGASTNNVYQTIGVEANKACYSVDPSEKIEVTSFQVDGTEKLAEINKISTQETYKAITRAEWTPTEPLSVGTHDVLVKFQSNVGVSQAIWSFNVDTIAPAVSIGTLEAFAPRAPGPVPTEASGKSLNIKYSTADNISQFLKNISIRVYKSDIPDEDTNFVTEITTIAAQAVGEQFVTWDGKKADGSYVDDGIYTIRIKAFDQAGNWGTAEARLIIDSTPPQILAASISPNPTTSATNEIDFSGRFSEKSLVTIKLTNLSENQTTAYLTPAFAAADTGPAGASYAWRFDDPFTPGLRDGVYRIEVKAVDDAGNESLPTTIEGIRIDRTPPVISAQHTDPFVLANVGANPYLTTLRYQISEANDVSGNRQAEDNLNVKIKLYNENTGELIKSEDVVGQLSAENSYSWDASDSSIGKGSYKFQIVAYDKYGNYSTAYTTCVKDGIAPAISSPLENSEIAGTVTIRGTAMDPDWTNDRPFKQYSVYYKQGSQPATINPGADWQTDVLEVPEIYRTPGSPNRNISIKPVQNDATLAYFYTGSLTNDVYTILVIAEEDGGAKYASARTITVKNDPLSGAGANPIVNMGDLPPQITFDGNNSLPISFTFGGKDINAYVEVFKVAGAATRETVYYQYFPKLAANYYSGRPVYQSGNELGYFIWQDETGWHVRWNGETGKAHRFNGSLVAMNDLTNFTPIGDGVNKIASLVNWDRTMTGGEGGFDFKTASTQLIITSSLDNDPATQEDDYSSMITPYFGLAKYQPPGAPVMISGISNQGGSTGQTVSWNGKTDSGAFVDSGDYLVRVRAEGADGSGLTMIEKMINVTTPFELTNVKANTDSFNPLGLPDRVTVSYNLSKDARITLKVYKPDIINPELLATIDDGVILGNTNSDVPHQISWRGNFPDQNGTQVVTSGEYLLKLVADPVDGKSSAIEKTITPNIKADTGLASLTGVQLDQIGTLTKFNGDNVYVAQGSSDYYWQATGAGTYYPPQNYSYTLGIQGKQKASLYPYVPFAGILHRGFKKVYGKQKITIKFTGWVWQTDFFHTKKWIEDREKTIETDYCNYEITDVTTKCKNTFNYHAADLGWEGINKASISVSLYSADGWLIDSMKNNYIDASDGGGINAALSEKGVFSIEAVSEYQKKSYYWRNANHDYNENCTIHIFTSLADRYDYSRLTNRFVPWYGFVNRSHPSYEAFSGMTHYLQKLGFPGESYFNDPSKTIDTYNKEIVGEYDPEIYNPIAYLNNGKLVKSELDSLTAPTISGDTGVSSQDAYLADEYTEFIPITTPERGNFTYLGGIFDHYDGSKVVLKNQLSAYPIQATTNYRMPYDADNARLVELKWPNDNSEIATESARLLSKLGSLQLDNPQSYDLSTTAAYEIDTQELNDRMNSFEAANPGIALENGWFKKPILVDTLSLDKTRTPIDYYKDLRATLGNNIPKPDYVTACTYQDFNKSPSNITISYDPNNQNSNITISAPASAYGQTWSTSDDPILRDYAGGAIKGGPETFNKETFSPLGKSDSHYFWQAYKNNYLKYQTSGLDNSKCAFWKDTANSDNLIDNPNMVINSWQIALKDEAGQTNQDLEIKDEDIHQSSAASNLDDYFQTKLKYYAKESRLVKLTGKADSAYELMYYDGNNWQTFAQGEPINGGFSVFWDVGRLCGKHTVLLKTASAISSQDVYLGKLVPYNNGQSTEVASAYRRAEVFFKPTSFSRDEFASVTPVTMSEINIRDKPILTTHGPIVELKPSPYTFKTPADGEEDRPYLRFSYTADDLKEGYGIIVFPNDPDWKTKTQDLWIHQVTADGDLQMVQDKEQKLYNDGKGNAYFAFEAALDHFSDYILLKGKFSLSAPMVFADSYITNKNTVTVYGTAEPGSIVTLYAKTENVPPDVETGESYAARMTAEAITGNFRFENITLPQEGNNYFFVTSHQGDDKSVRTMSDVTVVKDTVPPSAEASQNLYAFSPNGDGKYDSVDYLLKSNEKGKMYFQLSSNGTPVLNQEISAEANQEVKLTWAKDTFQIYRRDNATGQWILFSELPINQRLADGEYVTTVYAIDEAGNISNNVINKTILDTTPPTVIGLNADPNPFTPNDDGVKDTTTVSYKFSKPVYVTLSIYRDDGNLFRNHEGPTENFVYPTDALLPSLSKTVPAGRQGGGNASASAGEFIWDGHGSRNELIGGTYTYEVYAEDYVGNCVTSEAKTVVVDTIPTLIPYAYAEPDPFAPVNPNNSFTAIKYYLGRDNLKTKVLVIGQEGKTIKTLVNDDLENKGEHSVRWYGDFDPGYDGPTAEANKYQWAIARINSK